MCDLYSQGGLYSEVAFYTGLTVYFISLQQALLSLSGNLAVSLLVADVICAETDEQIKAKILGTTLFMSGITTLMMTFVGTRLPLFQGAAGDYVIPLLVMVAVEKDRCVLDPDRGMLNGVFFL